MNSNFDFGRKITRLKRDLAEGLVTPLRELLPDGQVMSAIEEAGKVFRHRIYTPLVTFWAFLSQVLGAEKSCRAIVTRLLSGVAGADRNRPSEDTGAYCRARKRLPEEALKKLVRETAATAEKKVEMSRLWKGRRVLLADGTCVSMPETKQLVSEFGRTCKRRRRGFPVAKIVALISLAAGVVVDAAVGPWRKHERELLRELWRSLVAGDVLAADRGFGSYAEIFLLKQRGVDCLFRLNARRKTDFRHAQELGHDDYLVTWDKPNYRTAWLPANAQLPDSLTVRIITFQPRIPGFRTREVTIVTTLEEPDKYQKEDLIALYRARWNIEIDLRHIKSTLEMNVLRGLSPDIVRREIWIHFIAYNLICTVMLEAAVQHGVDFSRLSFKGALVRIDAWTRTMNTAPLTQLTSLYAQLLKRIAEDQTPFRPNRIEPRCVKRLRTGYAMLTVTREKARRDLLRKWPA
jgi:hypothetical protein